MHLGSLEDTVGESVAVAVTGVPQRVGEVVMVLLISPDGKNLCLTLHQGAKRDGRLNLSPPQGDILPGQTASTAARIEIYDTLGVNPGSSVVFLTSETRKLPDNHHHRDQYDAYLYHCVALFAGSWSFVRDESKLASVQWCHLDSVRSHIDCMSDGKGEIFQAALDVLIKKAGRDPLLLRKSILCGQ